MFNLSFHTSLIVQFEPEGVKWENEQTVTKHPLKPNLTKNENKILDKNMNRYFLSNLLWGTGS